MKLSEKYPKNEEMDNPAKEDGLLPRKCQELVRDVKVKGNLSHSE